MAVPAYPRRSALCLCVLFVLVGLEAPRAAGGGRWADISSDDLRRTTPELSADSPAEILLKEAVLNRSSLPQWDEHHVVVKIYTKSGVEEFSKIDILQEPGTRIHDIEARVLKPDGTTLTLKPSEVHERDAIAAGGMRIKTKSFAPPGLDVGSILEYRYSEACNRIEDRLELLFQSACPARLVRFKVKPWRPMFRRSVLRSVAVNCPSLPLKQGALGFFTFEQKNVPAVQEEPLQPPKIDTEIAIILYYSTEGEPAPSKFWTNRARALYRDTEERARASGVVKSRLAEIVSPEDSPMVKLQKIHDYCRTKILNRHRRAALALKPAGSIWEPNRNAADVLTAGNGWKADINLAFVALARAAGFDARLALCNNRSFMSFNLAGADTLMLPDRIAAVRIDSRWVFCAPGSTHLPMGVLTWRNSDAVVLVGDKEGKEELFVARGLSHDKSVRKRVATFTLDSDGTLDGDVIEAYSGLYNDSIKDELEANPQREEADYIKASIQKYQSMAEITDIRMENADDPIEPIRITYHLHIPQYADQSEKRLFVRPSVFEKGVSPLFEAEERRTDIAFHFRYTTSDEVRIKLPHGFTLEQASAPQPLSLGSMGELSTKISFSRNTNEVIFSRTFALKEVLFKSTAYKELKAAFEEVCARDAHTLVLRRTE